MEAPQTRIPASRLLDLTVQKSSGAVTGGRGGGGGGALFERLSWRSDAPCAGCGGSRHGDSAMSGAERTTSLQSCCWLLLEFSWGLRTETSWTLLLSANMYSAALLLMLAVRIYADSMEGPTGKNKKERRRDVRLRLTSPLRVAAFKVDPRGLKSLFPYKLRAYMWKPRSSLALFFFFLNCIFLSKLSPLRLQSAVSTFSSVRALEG